MSIDICTPAPPFSAPAARLVSDVGTLGSGNIQLRPRYWTLELLIWFWGL